MIVKNNNIFVAGILHVEDGKVFVEFEDVLDLVDLSDLLADLNGKKVHITFKHNSKM